MIANLLVVVASIAQIAVCVTQLKQAKANSTP